MKVTELINKLSAMPGDADVLLSLDVITDCTKTDDIKANCAIMGDAETIIEVNSETVIICG